GGRINTREEPVAHPEMEIDAEEGSYRCYCCYNSKEANCEAVLWLTTHPRLTQEHQGTGQEHYSDSDFRPLNEIAEEDAVRLYDRLQEGDVPAVGVVFNSIVQSIC